MSRIAIVTGATRKIGIGAAICHALAEAGMDIFFTYWNSYDQKQYGSAPTDAFQLEEALREYGVRVGMMEVDLMDAAAPERLLAEVRERLGEPSVLVNNAAYSTNQNFETVTAEDLDRHYFVNVRGTLLLSAAFARGFSGEHGRIVNLTSGQSRGPMQNELAYVASKGAIEALTVSLADEVAERMITVNAVNPGPTDTGWMTPDLEEVLLPRFPFGRIGQPSDVAKTIRFLASEEAAWVTGQVIHSEGGFRRG